MQPLNATDEAFEEASAQNVIGIGASIDVGQHHAPFAIDGIISMAVPPPPSASHCSLFSAQMEQNIRSHNREYISREIHLIIQANRYANRRHDSDKVNSMISPIEPAHFTQL